MSNSSIAAFRAQPVEVVVDHLRQQQPGWRLSIDASRFDGEANIIIVSNAHTVLVWARSLTVNASVIYAGLGARLAGWWIEVFFLEHLSWAYNLHHGCALKHRFLPCPEIWNDPEVHPGDTTELAVAWPIEPGRIQKYLRRWRSAWTFWRDRDAHPPPEQGFDFLQSLTGLSIPVH